MEDEFNAVMDFFEQMLAQKHISAIIDMYVYKLIQGKISTFSDLVIPDYVLHTPLFNIEVEPIDKIQVRFLVKLSSGNEFTCDATVGAPLEIMEHNMKQHTN